MKGLLLYSNNCEDVETVGTTALLRRAGAEIVTATFNDVKEIKCVYGTSLKADSFVKDLDLDSFDFLIIPGGSYVVKSYDKDLNVKNLVLKFNSEKKLIAAICAGPMFLGEAGLLKDKSYTIFPGCERKSFGGNMQQYYKVVQDDNLITARSVGAVIEFSNEIIKYLKGCNEAKTLIKDIYY